MAILRQGSNSRLRLNGEALNGIWRGSCNLLLLTTYTHHGLPNGLQKSEFLNKIKAHLRAISKFLKPRWLILSNLNLCGNSRIWARTHFSVPLFFHSPFFGDDEGLGKLSLPLVEAFCTLQGLSNALTLSTVLNPGV